MGEHATSKRAKQAADVAGRDREQAPRVHAAERAQDPRQLAEAMGNAATSALISERSAPRLTIQAKLTVGAADDPLEREADRIADRVVPGAGSGSPAPHAVRQASADALAAGTADLMSSFDAPAAMERQIQARRGGGHPLPDRFRDHMESHLGADLGDVRVHTGRDADALNRSMAAKAFTVGTDVFLSSAAEDVRTGAGQRLLAHELTHVVQQGGAPAIGTQRIVQRRMKRRIQRFVYQGIVDQFTQGDLMYGLSWARADTQTPVKAKMRLLDVTGGNLQQAASVLDELNNQFVGTGNIGGPAAQSAATYGMAYGTPKGQTPDAPVVAQAQQFRHFVENDPAFAPFFTGTADRSGKAGTHKDRTWDRIRKVCKAGLKYTTTGQNRNIYFILDDLNMADVVNKVNYNKEWNEMKEPGAAGPGFDPTAQTRSDVGDAVADITPAELRYIYRNRGDAAFINRVSFWKGGKQVPAPWVSEPQLWQKYENARAGAADNTPTAKAMPVLGTTAAAQIGDLRTMFFTLAANRDFSHAAKNAITLGLEFETTKGVAQSGLVKKVAGLATLDDLRDQAKRIDPAASDKDRRNEIARIAGLANTAADPGGGTKFLDMRLDMAHKVAYYLFRRMPDKDVAKGATFQAQEGVTGISARSQSPVALIMLGLEETPRRGFGEYLRKRLAPPSARWVDADPSQMLQLLPSYKEAQRAGTATTPQMEAESERIAKRAANRAIDKHRHVVIAINGKDPNEIDELIRKLAVTDYRVSLGMSFADAGNAAPSADEDLVARNFTSFVQRAHGAFLSRYTTSIEWQKGKGSPYRFFRDKRNGASTMSMAGKESHDPNFELAATRFEERLGNYAFGHSKAKSAVQAMADKVVAYMDARGNLHAQYLTLGQTLDEFDPNTSWEKLGDFNTRMAGAVGKNITSIKAAVQTGNIREQLTHIYNFFNSIVARDAVDGTKADDIKRAMKAAKVSQPKIQTRAAELAGPNDKFAEKIPATNKSLPQRGEIRAKAQGSAQSDRTAADAVGLSAREKAHMGLANDTDRLTWNEGAKAWLIQEQTEWAKTYRGLGLPIAAGPSGHTNTFMQIAEYLKVNRPYDVRLGIIGHLLPIRAHSLVEILEAAKHYGADYTPGRGIHHDIRPLSEKTLRNNVAENAKFPDELASAPV